MSAYSGFCGVGCDQSGKLRLRSTLSSLTRRTHDMPYGLRAWTITTRTSAGRVPVWWRNQWVWMAEPQ